MYESDSSILFVQPSFHTGNSSLLLFFQTVMKSTRRQLERELLLEDITRLEDMPSYSLLQ